MKLDKFQEAVKAKYNNSSLTEGQLSTGLVWLQTDYSELWEELSQKSYIDPADFSDAVINHTLYLLTMQHEQDLYISFIELIQETLEEIEDIEEVNSMDCEVCDMEAYKRDKEMRA